MRPLAAALIFALALATSSDAFAAPAQSVLGHDYSFPNRLHGLPTKLSDFKDLQINTFQTNDGVTLSYWEAGRGKPLIFVPGWSANGAEYINVMYLLRDRYHVYVLDPRNQGLSQNVEYGARISRYAMDLKELSDHLGLRSASYCGWSMGAAVLWSYVDLFGTRSIDKLAFIDEAPSIYSHADWSEQERLDAGGFTTSPEQFVAAGTKGVQPNLLVVATHVFQRYMAMDSPYFQNSEGFARQFMRNDMAYMRLVLFDVATGDWRDVIRKKIDVPTAIFTGELSDVLPSQRWMNSVLARSTLYVYSKADQGDHFLAFKNPVKFTRDLQAFLER